MGMSGAGAGVGGSAGGGMAGSAGMLGSGAVGTAGGAGGAGDGGSASAAGGAGGASGSAGVSAGSGGAGSGGVSGAGTAGADAGSGGSDAPVNDACLDGITDYANPGPFEFTAETSGQVKLWVPKVPAGCQVPIVHFANGTGASCSNYQATLEHLASHGFLATCFENTATGQGTQCVTAVDTALMEHPELASMRVGSGGHQTGGGSALLCVAHLQEKWGSAMRVVGHGSEPDLAGIAAGWPETYAKIASPIFIFNGSEDQLVSENATREHILALPAGLEAYWYEAIGAPHIPVPARWMSESMVAWFRWKLVDDAAACEYFHAMPDTADWDLQEQRNPSGC
jgi:hypothetical protein